MKISYMIAAIILFTAMTIVTASEENKFDSNIQNSWFSYISGKKINSDSMGHENTLGKSTSSRNIEPDTTSNLLTFILEQEPGDMYVSKLVGVPVLDSNGKHIATISDLVLDSSHRVNVVVIKSGNILGIGGNQIALSHEDLLIAQDASSINRNARTDFSEQDVINVPDFRPDGKNLLALIPETSLVDKTIYGDRHYKFRFIANGCPKIQPVNIADEIYIF